MAELVEWSLPTPVIRGSNPVISKISSTNFTREKTKIKKKRLGIAHLKKEIFRMAAGSPEKNGESGN